MPHSKNTSPSHPKRPVFQNRIILPFDLQTYQSLILSSKRFRPYLQQEFLRSPELFPSSFAQGFQMKDLYYSKKQKLYFRRIRIGSKAYQIRPSFVTPYLKTLKDSV
jgi:hypothetical protein